MSARSRSTSRALRQRHLLPKDAIQAIVEAAESDVLRPVD
jgi:hypothetical protein